MQYGNLHNVNCVITFGKSLLQGKCYTIYNTLCNYPYYVERNITSRATRKCLQARYLKALGGARCSAQGFIVSTPCGSLPYNFPSSCYMAGGPLGHRLVGGGAMFATAPNFNNPLRIEYSGEACTFPLTF